MVKNGPTPKPISHYQKEVYLKYRYGPIKFTGVGVVEQFLSRIEANSANQNFLNLQNYSEAIF